MTGGLQHITRLLKQKEYDRARAELRAYLQVYPDHAEAWYLLSLTLADRQQQVTALQRALKLDPHLTPAQARLDQLRAEPGAPSTAPHRPWWAGWWAVMGGLVLVALMALGGALLATRLGESNKDRTPSPTRAELPVQALPEPTDTVEVTPSDTPTPRPPDTAAPTRTPTATKTAAPVIRPSDTPTGVSPTVPVVTPVARMSSTPKAGAVATRAATGAPSSPTEGASGLVVLPSPTPTKTFTPLPPTTAAPVPTVTVMASPGVTSMAPAASVTPYTAPTPSGSAVALGTFGNVSGGRVMVISAVRPATAAITEIGGTVPAPPAGSDWLLVEVLAECADAECTLAQPPLRVTGASGQSYDPSPQFQSDLKFSQGAAVGQQVWGYQAFLVPASEQSLRLVVQGALFALE